MQVKNASQEIGNASLQKQANLSHKRESGFELGSVVLGAYTAVTWLLNSAPFRADGTNVGGEPGMGGAEIRQGVALWAPNRAAER